MLKDLVTPENANVFVGKLGDILEKAIDKPLGYAINWGRIWSLWPVHIETACCSVEFGAASSPRYGDLSTVYFLFDKRSLYNGEIFQIYKNNYVNLHQHSALHFICCCL